MKMQFESMNTRWIADVSMAIVMISFLGGIAAGPVMAMNPCSGPPDQRPPECSDGGDGGDDGGGAMEAYTLNAGFCTGPDAVPTPDAELFADTRDDVCPFCPPPPGCQNQNTGSSVPQNNRDIFTSFGNCMGQITLPGNGSPIDLVRSDFSSHRDRKTGEIFSAQFFFFDGNGSEYNSNVVPAQGTPHPGGYTTVIDQVMEIRPKGGNKPLVGHICVDEVVYEPLP